MRERDLEAARECIRGVSTDQDLVFRLDTELADQLGAVSVETVQSVLETDGMFLTVPRALIHRARLSRVQFVEIVVTNGALASGVLLRVGNESVDVYLY